MDIQKKTRNDERRILTALIVDSVVLSRIVSKWDKKGLFKNKWSNLIGSWCVTYFKSYNKAPMQQIENLYEAWASKTQDAQTIKLVEKFLASLSKEFDALKEESNSDYIIDLAGQYFNQVKLEKLVQTLQNNLMTGDTASADIEINKHAKVELGVGEGIDVLKDEAAIKAAFESKRKPIIQYKKKNSTDLDALNTFFGSALERDGFISFLAPEKRGKTFWLLDMAYRAMRQKRRVAFFEAGDMSQNQVMRRLMTRITATPQKIMEEIKYPKTLDVSLEQVDGDGTKKPIPTVTHSTVYCKNKLNYQLAIEKCSLLSERLKSKDALFKLSCHPNSSLSINKIKDILQNWERQSWVPDVIIIDYADILDMNYPHLDGRDRINETWKQLRGISQTYHCLVVTATQSDAKSYTADTINRSHFSEDKRKLAHVTGMVGLNQTEEEKDNGIMRLNWIALRDGEFDPRDCVYTAMCLSLANPAVLSCFSEKF